MSRRFGEIRAFLARRFPVLHARRAMWRILDRGHGHAASVRLGHPVDHRGRARPWFTYPAIEFIEQFDLRERTVFEFGAGRSTIFWRERARRVVSVESDAGWHARLLAELGAGSGGELHLAPLASAYVGVLAERTENFDVIVVDGVAREACCAAAPSRLKSGGVIILDNAEPHPDCAEALREAGLLQVDMSGFGPVNAYAWVTSFFFDRRFDIPALGRGRPLVSVGGLSVAGALPRPR